MTKQVKYDDVSLVYPGGTKPAVAHLDLDPRQGGPDVGGSRHPDRRGLDLLPRSFPFLRNG